MSILLVTYEEINMWPYKCRQPDFFFLHHSFYLSLLSIFNFISSFFFLSSFCYCACDTHTKHEKRKNIIQKKKKHLHLASTELNSPTAQERKSEGLNSRWYNWKKRINVLFCKGFHISYSFYLEHNQFTAVTRALLYFGRSLWMNISNLA